MAAQSVDSVSGPRGGGGSEGERWGGGEGRGETWTGKDCLCHSPSNSAGVYSVCDINVA